MSAQRHRIRRQVLEITVQDAAAAWPLQSALSRIQSQHLEPLIDRCCTEAGDPERLHRIESLEIHLGRLDPANLEQDLLARLGPALRDALAKRIRFEDEETTRTGGDPEAESRLELVAQFARGGHLPWWADASRPRLLDEAIAFLLPRAGPSLWTLVRSFADERAPLLRLVGHCDDERLAALAGALLASSRPDVPVRPAEVHALLRAHRAIPRITSSAFRMSVWMGVLQVACIEDAAAVESAGPVGFWREALVRTALEAGVTYEALVTGLLDHVGRGGAGWPETLTEVVRRLATLLGRKGEPVLAEGDGASRGEGSEEAPEPREGGGADADPTPPVIEIERLFLRLARRAGPFGELFDALLAPLRTVARDAPTARQEALLEALQDLDQNAFQSGPLAPEAAARLRQALRRVALQEWLPAHVLRRAEAEALREPLASGADSTHAEQPPLSLTETRDEPVLAEGDSTPADVLRQSLAEARGQPVLADGDSTPAEVLRQSLTEARGEPVLAEGDSPSRGEASEAAPEPHEGGSAHAVRTHPVIEIERLLLRLARRGGPFGELFDAILAPLRTVARDAPTARQEVLLAALRDLDHGAFQSRPLPPAAAARLRQALRRVALQEWLPAHVLRRAVAEALREPLASGADSTHAEEHPLSLTEARSEPVLADGDSTSRGEGSEEAPEPREDGSAHADPADTVIEIERLLLRLARRGAPFGELFDALVAPLRTAARDAPTARQEALLEALRDLDQQTFQSGPLPPEAAARLRQALRRVALQEWLPAHVLRQAVAEALREPLASGADSTHAEELLPSLAEARGEPVLPDGDSTPAHVLRQSLTEARGEPVLADGDSPPADVLRQSLTEARSEPVLAEGNSPSRGDGSEAAPEPREGGSADADPADTVIEIERLLLRLARRGGPFGELFDALLAPLRTAARDAPTARQEALLEALRDLDQNAFQSGPLPPAAAARLRQALRRVALQEWLPAHVLRQAIAEALREPLASGADSTHAEEHPLSLTEARGEPVLDDGDSTLADVLRQSLTEARGEPVLPEGDSTLADVLRQSLTEARGEPVLPEGDSPSRGEASEAAPEPHEGGSAHAVRTHPVIEIERLLLRLARRGGPFGELFDAIFAPLRTVARDAPTARQEALLEALRDLDQPAFQAAPLPPEAAARLLPALMWLTEQGKLPVDAGRGMLEQISRDDTPSSQATEAPTTTEAVTAEPLAAEPLAAAPLTDVSVERAILREIQTWPLGANAPGAPRDLPSPRRGAVPEPLAGDPTAPGQPLQPLSPGPRFLPAAEGTPRISGDDQPEAIYVENAGLVVLWPFLGHLFERLELTVDRRFKDVAARLRAAGLLQHLATGELEPVEYQLPLAKVLCGLEVTDLFDFGPPVTEPEADECTNLLTAAIANAPILGEMSIDGFRGSFLIRKGVLGMRDGAFLLRVERVTYDVILDRFPWGMSWVKLPWMEAPLCVEW